MSEIRKTNWQHVKPQRDLDHIVFPVVKSRVAKSGKKRAYISMPPICSTCLKKIKEVPDNDGPESLKALFIF